MKIGTETNSLTNYLMSGTKGQPQPTIGMGCTILMWSDRKPATIVDIDLFKGGLRAGQARMVTVQEDVAVRTDSNGMSENQEYIITPNLGAPKYLFKVTKNGAFKGTLGQLHIGHRDAYFDFSF